MISIALKNVCKKYRSLSGAEANALKDITLDIHSGEFLTIVGASGCGKSTLLQLIAGIEKPNAGSVEVNAHGSSARIGFVFQANTVFPWRTVRNNLTYALQMSGRSHAECEAEAKRLCELIALDPHQYLDKYPKELSGGEMRRVAIGMSLAYQPDVLLLDEPTSQLDYVTRLAMQQTVQAIWMTQPFTTVYVTHDIEEAVLLGDRVLVLDKGVIKDSLTVDLARPRQKTVLDDPAFLRYRDHILESLEVA